MSYQVQPCNTHISSALPAHPLLNVQPPNALYMPCRKSGVESDPPFPYPEVSLPAGFGAKAGAALASHPGVDKVRCYVP
jgi:hypothetical protein